MKEGQSAAAGATGFGGAAAPSGSSAPEAIGSADGVSNTTAATLSVNGNNPTEWSLGQTWNDNLGALFTHNGQSETIYSTSTVDTMAAGTTTIDYWAAVPATDPTEWLHATRDVVIDGAANDNEAVANDNDPATTTAASSTAQ